MGCGSGASGGSTHARPPFDRYTQGCTDQASCAARCASDDARACGRLGSRLFGDWSLGEARVAKAVEAFEKACRLGDGIGCRDLALLHENGPPPLPRSTERARDNDAHRACVA
jgi:hypothetical protein